MRLTDRLYGNYVFRGDDDHQPDVLSRLRSEHVQRGDERPCAGQHTIQPGSRVKRSEEYAVFWEMVP
jgi:hypothetical protein